MRHDTQRPTNVDGNVQNGRSPWHDVHSAHAHLCGESLIHGGRVFQRAFDANRLAVFDDERRLVVNGRFGLDPGVRLEKRLSRLDDGHPKVFSARMHVRRRGKDAKT